MYIKHGHILNQGLLNNYSGQIRQPENVRQPIWSSFQSLEPDWPEAVLSFAELTLSICDLLIQLARDRVGAGSELR